MDEEDLFASPWGSTASAWHDLPSSSSSSSTPALPTIATEPALINDHSLSSPIVPVPPLQEATWGVDTHEFGDVDAPGTLLPSSVNHHPPSMASPFSSALPISSSILSTTAHALATAHPPLSLFNEDTTAKQSTSFNHPRTSPTLFSNPLGFEAGPNAADNASIIPIPPSETGTIYSVEDEFETSNSQHHNRDLPQHLHHLHIHSTASNAEAAPWGVQETLISSSVNASGATAFLDPLQRDTVSDSDSFNNEGKPAQSGHEDDGDGGDAPNFEFEVAVSEPQKVGNDPLSAHVSYKVRSRTNAPKYRNREAIVNRRYRDFLWLYNQLVASFPGVIVPPIPEKLAIGRFQDEFVESRRLALERCLKKIVSHPLLQCSEDLQMFLESETFSVDVTQRKREEARTGGGFLAVFNTAMTTAAAITSSKIENDQIFEGRRDQLDTVEAQLRALLKALENMTKYRKDLGATTHEFGESVISLAAVEVNKNVSDNLAALGNIQKRIRDIHEKQARDDFTILISVVDENIRIIGSIKTAFASRLKAYQSWQIADYNYQKKREALDKLKSSTKIRSDKISVGTAEINELEKIALDTKYIFDDCSMILRSELDKYEREKVSDFSAAIQGFLKSLIETQREIIAAWQTYEK